MKYFSCVWLIGLIVMAATATAQDSVASAASIQVGVWLNSTLSSSDIAQGVRVTSYYLPQQMTQEVLSFHAVPTPKITDTSLQYKWDKIRGVESFGWTARVRSSRREPMVKTRTSFPLESIPTNIQKYTLPTAMVDSGDFRILRQAQQIVGDKDDLFDVVSTLAFWTQQNINYNLSTLTAQAVQKATWVLENREGVCDEITTIFMAMLRSLGIPVRYVSGVSHTTSPLFTSEWGAHGWAEVWFPEGWVPFDPTFGQFGWVDAGHLKLRDSFDPSDPASRAEWMSGNLILGEIFLGAELEKIGPQSESAIQLEVFPWQGKVRPGSSNLAVVKVTSDRDAYQAVRLDLARVTGVANLDAKPQLVVLAPRGSQTVVWLVNAPLQVLSGYTLEVPLLVYTQENQTGNSSYTVASDAQGYSHEEAQQQMEVLVTPHVETRPAEFSCVGSVTYESERSSIDCMASSGKRLCLDSMCLTANSTGKIAFVFIKKPGQYTFRIRDDSSGASILSSATVLPVPRIALGSISVPSSVSVQDVFPAAWNATFFDEPLVAEVFFLLNDDAVKSWSPSGDSSYEMMISGGRLRPAQNVLAVLARWKDATGRQYNETVTAQVFLQTTWWERVILWVQGLVH